MDNDLISRSALLTELRSKLMLSAFPQYRTWTEMPSFERNAVCTYANTVKGIINKAHAVDAEPVRHSSWGKYGVCASCCWDAMYLMDSHIQVRTRYCPNCGAKMDAEVEG